LTGGERGPGAMAVDRGREEEIRDVSIVEDLGTWSKTVQRGGQWTKMRECHEPTRPHRRIV